MNLRIAALIASLLSLSLACGTLQISVVGTQAPDFASTGTIAALQTANAELATRVAVPSLPVSAQPSLTLPAGATGGPAPTATAVPATRIAFLSGATVGVVSAPIGAGQTQKYVLDVFQAQPMTLDVRSASGDVTVSVNDERGTVLVPAAAHQKSWQGSLSRTGDYFISIHGGASNENFTLVVKLPLPLHFAQGSDALTASGRTIAGYSIDYAVHAVQGQDMQVNIEDISTKGSLAVYGFQDDRQYLRADAGQKTFQLTLPATQDYIISIVPFDGAELNFTVTIQVR